MQAIKHCIENYYDRGEATYFLRDTFKYHSYDEIRRIMVSYQVAFPVYLNSKRPREGIYVTTDRQKELQELSLEGEDMRIYKKSNSAYTRRMQLKVKEERENIDYGI